MSPILTIVLTWFIFISKLDSSFALQDDHFLKIDTSNISVDFNPYVSILDQYNKSRYGIPELIPLIEKVSTRFKKLHIQLYTDHYRKLSSKSEIQDSLLLSPLAAAQYNCLPTTTNKIKVFLQIDHYALSKMCDCNRIYDKLHTVLPLAEKANTLCNETVSTILVRIYSTCTSDWCSFPDYSLKTLYKTLSPRFKYAWGLSVSNDWNCNEGFRELKEYYGDVLKVNYNYLDECLKPNLTACKFHDYNNSANSSGRKSVLLIKRVGPSRSDILTLQSMAMLESRWQDILSQQSDIYLMSFAFDIYDPDSNYFFGFGWWHLLKDPGSTNTKEFGFEEKVTVAIKLDYEEHPKHYQWLKQSHRFNKNITGIISHSITEFEYIEYFKFCRIMAIGTFDIMELGSILKKTQQRTGSRSCESGRHVYLLPFLNRLGMKVQSNFYVYTIKEAETKLSQGYAYPLDKCGSFSKSNADYNTFAHQLRDQSSKVLLFYFDEIDSIELGTTRLFRLRLVMFEKCKEIVQSFGRTDVEIAFVMLAMKLAMKFYRRVKDMQEYVKYIYSLSDWAETQVNIVVCLGLLEDKQIRSPVSRLSDSDYKCVGLYTYNKLTHNFTPKSTLTLELSQLRFPEPAKNDSSDENIVVFNVSQFFIIFSLLALLGVVIISLTTYLIRRQYKNNNISKTELEQFFNGKICDDCERKSSYEKDKYEISKKYFRVELDFPLGSGEFGAVYHGVINTLSREVRVAVKTSNPQKSHKTQITGLLSEIKVLAYIGKHPNIVELLGANTNKLKKGKVYIFLEFCHLGSLKKVLTDLRLLISSPVQETNVDTLTFQSSYVNSSSESTVILDAALSQDLYRWSTEICSGMAFLAEKHVVHADLATRNVLLNLGREAKICDFGLSRRMYNYTNYVKTQQEPLPWKWMAPEALRDMEFNEKTDVWAFGVTLWEMYSLGSEPFAGFSWDPNFLQMVERGLRLAEPEYCERNMFKRIKKCWIVSPHHRPKFSEMLLMLNSS